MDEAVAWAAGMNFHAIRLETQSSNVSACRFYVKYRFVLRGGDRYLYSQWGDDVRSDSDLYWYLFLPPIVLTHVNDSFWPRIHMIEATHG